MTFQRSNVSGEDIRRAIGMTEKRRQLIDASPSDPPVYEYGVNRLAKSLHPGIVKGEIIAKEPIGKDCCRITLRSSCEDGRFPYFRAGQFISLSGSVHGSFLSRPYSLSSSPKEALEGKMQVIVQKTGIFSSYLYDEAEIGTELSIGEPSGDFYHDDLRDKKHILAIAGGTGITPFLSMMKAISEGSEDFRMTLLYGARTREHMLFDPKDYQDERIRIVTILSDEEAEGYLHGFIDADLMKKYLDEDTSVFMCGPDAMYEHIRKELATLGFDRIRQERNMIHDRIVESKETYKLTVRIRDDIYMLDAHNEETILTAIERAGIPAVSRCRNGVCGFCHSRVINGRYFISENNDFRRLADRKFNYIHPCATYPESDMEIEIPVFNI